MKVYLKDGIVVAEAQNIKDTHILLEMARKLRKEGGLSRKKEKTKVKTARKNTYKKQYAKECDVCGITVKGNCGLAVHKRFHHPPARPVEVNSNPHPVSSL